MAQIIEEYEPEETFAVVTHLAGRAEKILNSPHITRLIVTDTVPVKVRNPQLQVLSIAKEIAEEIYESETI